MEIVFYYMNKKIASYIQYSLRSIKQFMPTAKIVHVTDFDTPFIDGVDETIRFKGKEKYTRSTLPLVAVEFMSKLDFKEMVWIDPDMMFGADVTPLMEKDFEIAVAAYSDLTPYQVKYPYCSLLFIKNPNFWKDCYKTFKEWDGEIDWLTLMAVWKKLFDYGKYKMLFLDSDIYNKSVGSRAKMRHSHNAWIKVYHFKGKRNKAFMKPFYEGYIA